MKIMHRMLVAALAAFFIGGAAYAQNAGSVTNHAFVIGKGPGQTGFTSLLCGSAQLAVGQSAADPICRTITGDVTIDASGVTSIGSNKVSNSMLRQSVALSMIGRSSNSSGDVADIQATAGSSCAFRESGNSISCGTLATPAYSSNSVTNAKLSQMANGTTKCRATAGTGDPEDCTSSQMRSLLSLVVGTNVQAWDADLDAIAALSSSGIIARTGAGTSAARTITGPAAGISVTNGDGVAGNPTIALSNDLAAIEGLSGTGIARRTGADTWSVGTSVANSELSTMSDGTVKANVSGSTSTPSDVTISSLLDKLFGSTQGSVVYRGASSWSALAPGTSGYVLKTQGAGANPTWAAESGGGGGGSAVLPGYIYGLTLSTAGSSSTFSVATGVATDASATDTISLGSAISKTTSSWSVGTGNGALDTGTIANNTWYHVFAIKRTDSGVVDILISTSVSSPTMPTNYTLKRRIGSMRTNGSGQWTAFVQSENEFYWTTPSFDVDATPGTTSVQSATLRTPAGVSVYAILGVGAIALSTNGGRALVYTPLIGSSLTATSNQYNAGVSGGAINANVQNWQFLNIRTGTSSNVNYSVSATDVIIRLLTYGWVDSRN